MSVQTPIFVSDNLNSSSISQTYFSCSVVDTNGNIYTSLQNTTVANYGAIQKTDLFGNTTLFLQLNIVNTPSCKITSRQTADKKLMELIELNMLSKKQVGRETVYINHQLISLISEKTDSLI